MSANMGTRTNTNSHNKFLQHRHMAVGMPPRTKCPECGMKKASHVPHPRCSRKLQKKTNAEREKAIEHKLMAAFGVAA